jgi:hypothetical protein
MNWDDYAIYAGLGIVGIFLVIGVSTSAIDVFDSKEICIHHGMKWDHTDNRGGWWEIGHYDTYCYQDIECSLESTDNVCKLQYYKIVVDR